MERRNSRPVPGARPFSPFHFFLSFFFFLPTTVFSTTPQEEEGAWRGAWAWGVGQPRRGATRRGAQHFIVSSLPDVIGSTRPVFARLSGQDFNSTCEQLANLHKYLSGAVRQERQQTTKKRQYTRHGQSSAGSPGFRNSKLSEARQSQQTKAKIPLSPSPVSLILVSATWTTCPHGRWQRKIAQKLKRRGILIWGQRTLGRISGSGNGTRVNGHALAVSHLCFIKQLIVAFLGGPKEMPKSSVGLAFFPLPSPHTRQFASPLPPLCGITHLNQIWARKLARANHAYSLPITPYSVLEDPSTEYIHSVKALHSCQ